MNELGPVRQHLSYESLLMLLRFRDRPSFGDVAQRLGKDERTVSRTLRDLSSAFEREKRVALLARPAGNRVYELTDAGKAFCRAAESAVLMLDAAVTSAGNTAEVLELPVTNDLLRDLHSLSQRVRGRGVTLYPRPRRSADFSSPSSPGRGFEQNGYHYALFSTALSNDFGLKPGKIVQLENDREFLVRSVDTFQLLAPADVIGDEASITLPQVRTLGITLLVPEGGAARQYLEYVYPDGPREEPQLYVLSTDLDFGLKCLALELIPLSGMIVHGWAPDDDRIPRGYGLTPLESNPRRNYSAATGLFHDRGGDDELSAEARKRWSMVWQAAKDLWVGSE